MDGCCWLHYEYGAKPSTLWLQKAIGPVIDASLAATRGAMAVVGC